MKIGVLASAMVGNTVTTKLVEIGHQKNNRTLETIRDFNYRSDRK